ncbi:hypothetical protein [Sporosarcina sp. NPDC096371]|uniref:hypothetical protein n=1 Tax=Sporosarcina sp. NPDC096371 TaxID=3364530 RepID=UPI0037F45E66
MMNIGELGAYTIEKKDVLIILRNEPLMFVQGPPVYIKVVPKQEESTSVFVMSGEEKEVPSEVDQEIVNELEPPLEDLKPEKVVDPSLVRRIMYLGTPFSRQVYHPLQFVLDDGLLTGTIEKIEGETVFIRTGEDGRELVAVEMASIGEVFWRGDPFAED